MNSLYGKVGKEGTEKPEAGDGHGGALAGKRSAAENQDLRQGNDCQEEKNDVNEPGANTEHYPTPMRGDAPKSAVPETLGKIQQRQDTQANCNAQQQKAPIHSGGAPKSTSKLSMPGVGILHDGGEFTA
jgi:hypothetical protein